MSAVSPIAAVPQKVTRITARSTLDPPALAATDPNMIKKMMPKLYCKYTIALKLPRKATITGSIPPKINAAPDANAA